MLPITILTALLTGGAVAGAPEAPVSVEVPAIDVGLGGDTGLDEPISAELVGQTARAVTEHRGALRRCVAPELTHAEVSDDALDAAIGEGALTGGLLVSFVVGVDGEVSDVELQDATLAQPEIETCIAEVFEELRFPESELEAPEVVRFPLVVIY